MEKLDASIGAAAVESIETIGSNLFTSLETLMNKIATHSATFPTVVPRASSINHSLQSVAFFPLGDSFKRRLHEYSIRIKKLASETTSTEQDTQTKKRRFELDYQMIKHVQLAIRSFNAVVNPYLTAVGKDRLSCTFKDSDSQKIFTKQVTVIIYLIKKIEKAYSRVIKSINLSINCCNRMLTMIQSQYDASSLDKIKRVFLSKLDHPDLYSTLAILQFCLPDCNISNVQEPYQDAHHGKQDLPTFTKLTKIVPNVSAHISEKNSEKPKETLPSSIKTQQVDGAAKVLKP